MLFAAAEAAAPPCARQEPCQREPSLLEGGLAPLLQVAILVGAAHREGGRGHLQVLRCLLKNNAGTWHSPGGTVLLPSLLWVYTKRSWTGAWTSPCRRATHSKVAATPSRHVHAVELRHTTPAVRAAVAVGAGDRGEFGRAARTQHQAVARHADCLPLFVQAHNAVQPADRAKVGCRGDRLALRRPHKAKKMLDAAVVERQQAAAALARLTLGTSTTVAEGAGEACPKTPR